jgi:hypothetical protein
VIRKSEEKAGPGEHQKQKSQLEVKWRKLKKRKALDFGKKKK